MEFGLGLSIYIVFYIGKARRNSIFGVIFTLDSVSYLFRGFSRGFVLFFISMRMDANDSHTHTPKTFVVICESGGDSGRDPDTVLAGVRHERIYSGGL